MRSEGLNRALKRHRSHPHDGGTGQLQTLPTCFELTVCEVHLPHLRVPRSWRCLRSEVELVCIELCGGGVEQRDQVRTVGHRGAGADGLDDQVAERQAGR